MAGWFGSKFAKGPEKLVAEAKRFAAGERWPEAIDSLEKALARAAQGPPGYDAVIRGLIDRYSEAYVAQLEEAIPRFLEDGNREKAAEFVEIALTFTNDEERRASIGAMLAAHKREKDETRAPRRPDMYPPELIDSLMHGYLESLEPAEQVEVQKRSFTFQKAFVYWHQGEAEEARIAAEDHLARSTDDAWGHLYLGLSLASLDRTDDAVRALEAAVGLDPSLLPATLALAGVERHRENWERAIELLETASNRVRSYTDLFSEKRRDEVWQTMLQVFVEAGRPERAERLYATLRGEGKIAENLAIEARLAEARGDEEDAADRWETLLGARPTGGGTITGHGSGGAVAGPAEHEEAADFYYRRGDGKRAMRHYERAALQITERIHYAGEDLPEAHLFRLKKKYALAAIGIGRFGEAKAVADELARLESPPPELDEIRRALEDPPAWPESTV